MSRATSATARPAGLAGASKGSSEIPQSARKAVQSLKEIVLNSEEEIYACLKECAMDPNLAVERLVTQDPFHEVKRKRDKKKEVPRDSSQQSDARSRSTMGSPAARGGRGGGADRGAGRGGGRFSGNDAGPRGRPMAPPRENGFHAQARPAGGALMTGPAPPAFQNPAPYMQSKPYSSVTSHVPHVQAAAPPLPSLQPFPQMPSVSTSVAVSAPAPTAAPGLNGGANLYSPVTMPARPPQGSWGGGQTMADIVKASSNPASAAANSNPTGMAPPAVSLPSSAPSAPAASVIPSPFPQAAPLTPPPSSPPSSTTTGLYNYASDAVLNPALDPRAPKRDVGTVGTQRPIGERSAPLPAASQAAPASQSAAAMGAPMPSSSVTPEASAAASVPSVTASSVSSALPSEPSPSQATNVMSDGGLGGSVSPVQQRPAQQRAPGPPAAAAVGSQLNGRAPYQPQAVTKAAGSNLEWKPKASSGTSVGMGGSVGATKSSVADLAPKMTGMSLGGSETKEPVIIPGQFQVSEADHPRLSFGSFGSTFGTAFGPAVTEEPSVSASKGEQQQSGSMDQGLEPSTVASSSPAYSAAQLQQSSHTHTEAASAPVAQQQQQQQQQQTAAAMSMGGALPELSKNDNLLAQGHMPYSAYMHSNLANYPGTFAMSPYSDAVPGGSYYTPAPGLAPAPLAAAQSFRPQASMQQESEARYGLSGMGTSKFGSGVGHSSSHQQDSHTAPASNTGLPQHSATPSSMSHNPPTPQRNDTSHSHSTATHTASAHSLAAASAASVLPAGPLPLAPGLYPQPGALPMSTHYGNMYGYGYPMQANPAYYMHGAYSHSYGAPAPSPAGNAYPGGAGGSYPAPGAASVKYPVGLNVGFKPGGGAAAAPHAAGGVAGGYAGYGAAPSGYGGGPGAVSAGSASGYEDVSGSQFKDNLFIPQQDLRVQAQMTRDLAAAAGMPNSYYNQHAAYGQQPGAYATPGLYHQPTAGPAAGGHQLLNPGQAMQGSSAGNAAGGYQQQQRGGQAQSWNNYS